jgi:hypothetical protein
MPSTSSATPSASIAFYFGTHNGMRNHYMTVNLTLPHPNLLTAPRMAAHSSRQILARPSISPSLARLLSLKRPPPSSSCGPSHQQRRLSAVASPPCCPSFWPSRRRFERPPWSPTPSFWRTLWWSRFGLHMLTMCHSSHSGFVSQSVKFTATSMYHVPRIVTHV